jgi:transcriptional regulator with XRE-family HTH domain
MKSARLQLSPDFPDLVARAGLSQRSFARRAGVSFSILMSLVHSEIYPGRRGGMQRRSAWRIAKAHTALAGLDVDSAFRLFIIERSGETAPSPGVTL